MAIKNDGFTEFFEIKDKKENSNENDAKVNAKLGTNNDFALIQASMEGKMGIKTVNGLNNEKSYKKTHTPTSLFMQVYQYLKQNDKIVHLQDIKDLENINSGEFVELKSNIELNTIVDFFETLNKVIDITEALISFSNTSSNQNKKNNPLSQMKRPVENILKSLENENENANVKYGICKIEEKDLVLKLNKAYFINGDYSEIKNGEFRIIGKVLEVIPQGNKILLNRENAIGLYEPKMFEEVKNALKVIPNLKFKPFQDEVTGHTIVIMPIAIGI